jgi:hypothetical protein
MFSQSNDRSIVRTTLKAPENVAAVENATIDLIICIITVVVCRVQVNCPILNVPFQQCRPCITTYSHNFSAMLSFTDAIRNSTKSKHSMIRFVTAENKYISLL